MMRALADVGIVGQVGSGKTSLLHAILGEMEVSSGSVEVRGNFAYVAQTAFIVNATIKENILFGEPLDELLYDQCLVRAQEWFCFTSVSTHPKCFGTSVSKRTREELCATLPWFAQMCLDLPMIDSN
jgi:ABC-type multidrug transport system fused ATPase/permease subunit